MTPFDPEVAVIAAFVDGMTKAQVQTIRDRIAAESEDLEASVRERQASPVHANDFGVGRDQRRIGQLHREIGYLNAVLVAPRAAY